MGSCPSNYEADAKAYWTKERPCQCSRQYSFTTGLTWEVVEIIKYCFCCVEKATRQAVQATIRCNLCGHQFRRTYELRYQEKRKHKHWGYYGKRIKVKAHSADRFSFAHLEQCYALIEQYFLKTYGAHNVHIEPNKKWTEEFYQLVTAGEPNRSHRM